MTPNTLHLTLFVVVESSVNEGFCGQTLPPAADKLWEKSHLRSLSEWNVFPLCVLLPNCVPFTFRLLGRGSERL